MANRSTGQKTKHKGFDPGATPLRLWPASARRRFENAVKEAIEADSLFTWGPTHFKPEKAVKGDPFLEAQATHRQEVREARSNAVLVRSTPEGFEVVPAPPDHHLSKLFRRDIRLWPYEPTGQPRGRRWPKKGPPRPRLDIKAMRKQYPGADVTELARILGVHRSTLYRSQP